MLEQFFLFLAQVDEIFWVYMAFILVIILGSYLTIKNSFFQIRQIPMIAKTFFKLLGKSSEDQRGVHPLKAFFASAGGMIGIGNIVGIVTAVQLGGPGSLFWVWVAGTIGAIVKYGEVYLGLKYRVENGQGGYDGGPMYFLKRAFKNRFVPLLVCVLLCIYCIDIYQFSVVIDTISNNWSVNRYLATAAFLLIVLYASIGGVKRIAQICSWIMPFFLLTYIGMSFWIIFYEVNLLPSILLNVFKSAFSGHAAVGGFVGSSIILTIQHGISRAAYSADIGIGYDSIIQSESNTIYPERQARLAILGVFVDNLICSLSILVVLISGVWTSVDVIPGSQLVQAALSNYFPFMDIFMSLFLTVVGFTTIIAFFCVGIKCASFLFPKFGARVYTLYGAVALVASVFVQQSQALVIMSIAGAMLLILNLTGIFLLRKDISFSASAEEISNLKEVKSPVKVAERVKSS